MFVFFITGDHYSLDVGQKILHNSQLIHLIGQIVAVTQTSDEDHPITPLPHHLYQISR